MGTTKSEMFTKHQNEIATIIKALGHPARIAILEYLMKIDSCICSDIVDELPLAQPTISQHLKELKKANLIKGTVEGSAICYCIDENGIEKLERYFSSIANQLNEKKKNNCC